MAWEHLSITKPHLVYIILGGFTSLFMLCSSVIKERLYIGEATVATICGIIFGPHAADLINPREWGNVDLITLEFSRIVLVVQCFAAWCVARSAAIKFRCRASMAKRFQSPHQGRVGYSRDQDTGNARARVTLTMRDEQEPSDRALGGTQDAGRQLP